jgi:TatD DNase family protein
MDEDFEGVLERAKANDIDYMLCVSVNLEDYPEVLAIAQANTNIFASVGVHPCYQDVREPAVETLLELAQDQNVVAIGETGLDYFRIEGDLDWQQARFIRHIEAGIASGKPLIIHTRAAADDTMSLLKSHHADRCGGVMHCFAEDWGTAKKALDLGFYISFSGIVTFNSAVELKDIAKKVPLDRILLETDAPYLAPVPMRGKPNQPAFVAHTAQYVADLRGLELNELAEKTTNNFFKLFSSAIR